MGVFAEKGFEGASLADLCSAMGINRFSLYATYGNKESLYVRAMENFSQGQKDWVDGILAGKAARAGIEQLFIESVTSFTDPEALGVCFVTQHPLTSEEATEETRRFVAQKRGQVEEALRVRLQQAIAEGELPADASAEELSSYYFILLQGFALQGQHGGKRQELLKVVAHVMAGWP